jgi:hypothetical protein
MIPALHNPILLWGVGHCEMSPHAGVVAVVDEAGRCELATPVCVQDLQLLPTLCFILCLCLLDHPRYIALGGQ